ncbi:hypothetical protein GIB67_016284 [Kingdonia uniflora]|uniref:Tr-type G domain-containing protein n=1 Tax=Kingdonia uniflora TaxID=39325 RepID=A0A7J7M9E7_9MAGN|nr:hypothetical protein GIB67_016284 [Kingdonia uniflora]
MGKKKPAARDVEIPTGAAPVAKSKKKNSLVDDDEYSIGTDLSDEQPNLFTKEEPIVAKKKGDLKKEEKVVDDEEEHTPSIVFSGKKKSKSKKSGFSVAGFDILEDEDKDVEGENDVGEEGDDDPIVKFTGKKKSSKTSKKSNGAVSGSGFDALNEGDDEKVEEEMKEENASAITFSGKKKSSKSSKKVNNNNIFAAALVDDDGDNEVSVSQQETNKEEDEDALTIAFSGKKKSSKSKKGNNLVTQTSFETDVGDNVNESENSTVDTKPNKQGSGEVVETSKNKKKKKKKGGRTAQEEDDLDKLLAELGGGPPLQKPTGPPMLPLERVEVQPEPTSVVDVAASDDKETETEAGESAAAKKKKKKKEKEKEKKAAAVTATVTLKEEKNEETKIKVLDKKIPKHVREMQEALAKRQEAEERMKREEEERLKREEERLQKEEEEEKRKEEAKQRKKEKEKEKKERKRQEGRLLTGKQKEEARRLEAMRNQFLASGAVLPSAEDGSSSTAKRPKYQTKKSKPTSHSLENGVSSTQKNESQLDIALEVLVQEEESEPVKMLDVENMVEENGVKAEEDDDDDDQDWDAKSWDDTVVDLNVKSPFADEEVESDRELEPVVVVKKEAKRVTAPTSGEPQATLPPTKTEEVESRPDQHLCDATIKNKRKEAAMKRDARSKEALLRRSADNLRSPICCIMGHVDTGKTKLLDCIRGTNVQEGEAGGITQQIGATYFPAENIRERTKELKADATLRVPGLLVIDTPGHESFTNLRSRGSGLCDIAILVVDIMHGLEPQTIESLNLLKMRDTEFIVALNKVDRLYGWKPCPNAPILKAMKQQSTDVQNEFNMRVTQIKVQFMEQGLNTELYYKNKEMGKTFSIVPTSAISGEGIPDLLLLLVQWTSKTMVEKLMFSDEMQCIVLEVKVIEGLGTTIDVILINGILREGDQIVVGGMQEPIVTTIRSLLTPHPMKELRIKGSYLHHKELKAAQGIKITAQGLDHAIAGTSLYVVGPEDDLEDIKEAADQDIGTPICIPSREFIDIGRISSIEINHRQVNVAKKGQKVAIKIGSTNAEEQQKMYGRHFEIEDELVSHISRKSIDVLKANYREDPNMTNEEWKLLIKLKNLFKIQ